MPSPMRSNTFIKSTTSIGCWRDGYPCGQNGGQRSQRLVADFSEPTPAIAARVPPPEFFSTRTDLKMPGGMPLDTLAPVPEPTGEVSMSILLIPVSFGGEPPKQQPPPTGETIVSVLPITSSVPAPGNSPISTSVPYDPHSTWPSRWRGATSEVAAAPSQTADCNLHFCPIGTVNSTSTPPFTLLPTITGPAEPSVTLSVVSTSSHFVIPPDPSSPIVDTSTSYTSGPEMTPLPISTVSGIIQDPLLTSAPSTSSHFAIPPDPTSPIIYTNTTSSTPCATIPELTPPPISTISGIIQDPLMTSAPATSNFPSMSVPEGMQERLVYCGIDKCVPIVMADLTSCHGTPTPRSDPVATSEFTAPVAAATTAAREPITITIDCNRHYCLGIETVYTISPTPYTYPIVPATSGFAIPPEVAPVAAVNKIFVPIEFWRGSNESIVPDAPKTLDGVHGPIQRHSSAAPKPSVATNSPCYRHYCPSDSTPKPHPTTMLTTSKPAQPVESASLHFPSALPFFETLTA